MITAPILIGALLVAAVFYDRSKSWPKLRKRKERTPQEFFQDFYSESGLSADLVHEMYDFIESNFGTVSRLLPTDNFAEIEELGGIKFNSDTDFLYEATYRRLTAVVSSPEAQKEIEVSLEAIKTVDDLIRTIARFEASQCR